MNYLLSFDDSPYNAQDYGFIKQSSNLQELITEACNSTRDDLMIYGPDVDLDLFQSLRIDVRCINAAKKKNISPITLMLRQKIQQLEEEAMKCTKRKLQKHSKLEGNCIQAKNIMKNNEKMEKELKQVERELVLLRVLHAHTTYLVLFLERDIVPELMDVKEVIGFTELEHLIEDHMFSKQSDRTSLKILEHPFSTTVEYYTIIEQKHSLQNKIIGEQAMKVNHRVDEECRCYCFHCEPFTRREYNHFKSRLSTIE
jgi:hypothetical protein